VKAHYVYDGDGCYEERIQKSFDDADVDVLAFFCTALNTAKRLAACALCI
jgi:hypothetical protein